MLLLWDDLVLTRIVCHKKKNQTNSSRSLVSCLGLPVCQLLLSILWYAMGLLII